MKYIVYETTNKLNSYIYTGVHQTENPEVFDGYFGSGDYFKLVLADQGTRHFRRKTLFVFDTAKEAYAKEAEIVTKEYVSREDTYNLALGGGKTSGFDPEFSVASLNKTLHYLKLLKESKHESKAEVSFNTYINSDGDAIYKGSFLLASENFEYFLFKFREQFKWSKWDIDTLLNHVLTCYKSSPESESYLRRSGKSQSLPFSIYSDDHYFHWYEGTYGSDWYCYEVEEFRANYYVLLDKLIKIGIIYIDKESGVKILNVKKCWEMYHNWVAEDTHNSYCGEESESVTVNTVLKLGVSRKNRIKYLENLLYSKDNLELPVRRSRKGNKS